MRVHWTDTAQAHLDAIHAYIAQDSAEYANRTIDRLTRRSQQITDFPLSGRRIGFNRIALQDKSRLKA